MAMGGVEPSCPPAPQILRTRSCNCAALDWCNACARDARECESTPPRAQPAACIVKARLSSTDFENVFGSANASLAAHAPPQGSSPQPSVQKAGAAPAWLSVHKNSPPSKPGLRITSRVYVIQREVCQFQRAAIGQSICHISLASIAQLARA